MIEIFQPGHYVAAAAGLGVVYAVYRIAKSNREIRKSLKDLDSRVEPKLGNLSAQLNYEVAGRQMADSDLSRRISEIELARRNERRPGGDLHRAVDAFAHNASKPFGGFPGSKSVTSAPGSRSSSSRSSSSETPLSNPLHPANPLNPIYADDTPSRSSSSSHSSHDSGCSSRSSSSYSGGSSSSGSYDSGSSSSDSGSCSSSD